VLVTTIVIYSESGIRRVALLLLLLLLLLLVGLQVVA
jgi:hypothetical protein